ncbi:Protein of unknown function [Gryllus bimaculatus]|nr:Protein of unknown function [Gryllus bimaculatus]
MPTLQVTMGDPNPSPRLGRRLLRRYLDAAAQHTCPSSRPDSSAQPWKRTHRHASAPAAADSSPHDSYASGAPTQLYEEIQRALTATNWRSQPHPPRRRRGSFKSRTGPLTQPRRLFQDDSSTELDDFTDLPFHPTEVRPWTAPSMFSQQDWNTSYLPDNYYPTYCRGPLPKNYEYDEAYL